MSAFQFDESEAITEPSAVAPDAEVNFDANGPQHEDSWKILGSLQEVISLSS